MDVDDDIPNYAKVECNFTVLIAMALTWNIIGPWIFERTEKRSLPATSQKRAGT